MRTLGTNGLAMTCVLAIAAAAGSALAAVEAAPPRGALSMNADAGSGSAKFFVKDAGARISDAWRDNADLADKRGVVPPPTPGYKLSSRVIVRAAAIEEVEDSFKDAYPGGAEALDVGDALVRDVRAVPGFYIVEMPTIAEAAIVVELLKEDPRVEEAYLDIARPRQVLGNQGSNPRGAGAVGGSGDGGSGIDSPPVGPALPTDPGFPNQWHLHNTANPIADANVPAAWAAGYSGAGVTIGILEGGWQIDHPDLSARYNATASQPFVEYSVHGTSCAGVSAATANNGIGGCGAAPGAELSLQYWGTSSEIAEGFAFRNDLNDIKSNSWGYAGPGWLINLPSVEREGMRQAVLTGRGGRGTVMVFANGNSGTIERSDIGGHSASRWAIPVAAIGDQDRFSWYTEQGCNNLIAAPSNGNIRGIYTTDITGEPGYSADDYTNTFGGTSSACPLVAGIIGLMLEANPNLTVRDVKHILVRTARRCDPSHPLWVKNGANRWVNYYYGFGAIDAGAAVSLARLWTNVPPEFSMTTGRVNVLEIIPDPAEIGESGTPVVRTVTVTQPVIVEEVELVMNVEHTWIGDLRIILTSPSGMQSLLSEVRSDPQDNLVRYTFMTRRSWGEWAAGNWKIQISDHYPSDEGRWFDFTLNIHGRYAPRGLEAGEGTPTPDLNLDADGDGTITIDEAKRAIDAAGK
jgi:subtilisin-like proprotein convertase family protein